MREAAKMVFEENRLVGSGGRWIIESERSSLLYDLQEANRLLIRRILLLSACSIALLPMALVRNFLSNLPAVLRAGYIVAVLILVISSRGLIALVPLCHQVLKLRRTLRQWDGLERDISGFL